MKYEKILSAYQYDMNGLRTQKTSGGVTSKYFWDGNQLYAELRGNNMIYYYYDDTGIIAMNYQGADYYFIKNVMGDVIEIRNTNGVYVGGYGYDAYGNINAGGISGMNAIEAANPFRYRGYYQDNETGFYYLQSRYYDSSIMSFISPDNPTMALKGASTIGGTNLYSYCYYDPVNFIDSTGDFAITFTFLAWVAVALFSIATVAYIESEFHPIQTAFELLWQELELLGTQASNEIQYSQWEPGTWPGDDPTVAPGDDFVWRGPGKVGSDRGEWYNLKTGDQLHPDLFHKPPKGPHWGWRNKISKILRDIYKNGPGGPPTLA